jgi:hypothetical protein
MAKSFELLLKKWDAQLGALRSSIPIFHPEIEENFTQLRAQILKKAQEFQRQKEHYERIKEERLSSLATTQKPILYSQLNNSNQHRNIIAPEIDSIISLMNQLRSKLENINRTEHTKKFLSNIESHIKTIRTIYKEHSQSIKLLMRPLTTTSILSAMNTPMMTLPGQVNTDTLQHVPSVPLPARPVFFVPNETDTKIPSTTSPTVVAATCGKCSIQ